MRGTDRRKFSKNIKTILIGLLMISVVYSFINQNSIRVDGAHEKFGSSNLSMDEDLIIDGDDDFGKYSQITGNGTEIDPYLISGLSMNGNKIKVKNTSDFFTISRISWGQGTGKRMEFQNNTHIKMDNISLDSNKLFEGIGCLDLEIVSCNFSATLDSEVVVFQNLSFLKFINSSIVNTNNQIKPEVHFYGDGGGVVIDNSSFKNMDIYPTINGTHLVENCTFDNSYIWCHVKTFDSVIKYNNFINSEIQLNDYYSGEIYNNTFRTGMRGIHVFGADKTKNLTIIRDNSFSLCTHGIRLSYSRNYEIRGNTFSNCTSFAIYLRWSRDNIIWRNKFFNNNIGSTGCQADVLLSGNEKNDWDWNGMGNYWNDHTSPDVGGDGIVDETYNITDYNQDDFSLTNPEFDIIKPKVEFLSHSSGPIERSYNRFHWYAEDDYGIKKLELNDTQGLIHDVKDNGSISYYLEEGTYNLTLKATDENGLFNFEYLELELYETNPVINFTTIMDGYYIEYDPVPVQWDIDEYFPVVKQNLTIDGAKSTLDNEEREKNLDLEEGPHSLSLTLTDDLGLKITETVDFIVDRNPPLIELSGPTSGSVISTSSVKFNCSIFEVVGLESVRYRFNDKDWVFEDENFSVERVLDEGSHVFRIEALDGAGHLSELEITFKISNEDLVEVLSPENGTVFNKDTIDLEWTYGKKFLWSEAFLRLGADKEFFSIGTSYEYEMDFPEDGEYLVTLRLVDEVGNYIQSDFLVIKDTKDPTVGFLNADEINHINTWKFGLNWNAVDDYGIDHYELRVDEKDWDNRGLETTREAGLTEGEHTITIRAYDLAGNMDEAQISVIVDVTPPELEFDEMDVFTSTSIEIEWKANDLYGIENMFLTIGDLKPNDVTYKDSYSVVLNQDGIFDVILNATDLAGNLETITTTIVVDTTEPRAIWKDTSIEITNETDLKLEWEIDEDVGIQSLYLTIDGNKIDLDGNDTSYIADLEDGTHSISLTVVDIGGWQYTLDYPHDILVDSTPPTFQFDSKEICTDGKAVIQWTVSDDGNGLTVMVSVDGENYIEVPGTSYTTGSLPPGDHTIQLIIMDSAGNQVDETWTFTIEEEKDEESGGSGGFIAVIILIAVVLIIGIIGAVIFIFKKKEKEPEEKQDAKVTVPSGPPGIGSKKVDNNMLKAPPVNQMRELPAAGSIPDQNKIDERKG